jgi:hypothetical protein
MTVVATQQKRPPHIATASSYFLREMSHFYKRWLSIILRISAGAALRPGYGSRWRARLSVKYQIHDHGHDRARKTDRCLIGDELHAVADAHVDRTAGRMEE